MKYIQGIERNQSFLFPSTIDELIPEDNPARVIDVFVNTLDIQELSFAKSRLANTGRSPYHPKDLLKLYLYGYFNKIRSSRNLAKECKRNIEVIWLLKSIKPRYKSIADFRKDHPEQLRKIFRQFVGLCLSWGLYGKELIAVDSSGFRAVNSKKNNYNQKKIDRQLAYIEEKMEKYLKELDRNDSQEKDEVKISKEEIKRRIETLKTRKAKYKKIEKQLKESDSEQISTTDSDSRLLVKNGQPAEVAYNIQVSVDHKNKLIVDYKTTNQNDRKQLHDMATRTKEEFKVDSLNALADKGYHNAEELHKCQQDNITTHVGVPRYGNNTSIPASGYHAEDFAYNKQADCYICPQEVELLTNGKFYKKPGRNEDFTLVKQYHSKMCKGCRVKHLCTISSKGRVIERSRYQDAVDANAYRIKTRKEKYLQRQMIVEHPFGTIKRTWGYNYVLVKSLDKVDGEFGLVFLCYNLKRVINMIGTTGLINRLIACSCFLLQIWAGIRGYSVRKWTHKNRELVLLFSKISICDIFVPGLSGLRLSFCTV
jgi:transposase